MKHALFRTYLDSISQYKIVIRMDDHSEAE